jgi:hypothetical protein
MYINIYTYTCMRVFVCVCECATAIDRNVVDVNVKGSAWLSLVVAYHFCARDVRSMFASRLVSVQHFTAQHKNQKIQCICWFF